MTRVPASSRPRVPYEVVKGFEEERMPYHIKTAALAGQQEEADDKVRSTVGSIIGDVANARRPGGARSFVAARRRRLDQR
jgi:hypothetical protein